MLYQIIKFILKFKKRLLIFDDENIKKHIQKNIIDKNYLNFFIEKNYTPGNITFLKI